MDSRLELRVMTHADLGDVLAFCEAEGVVIGQVRCPRVNGAVCRDALRRRDVLVVVARADGRLAGVVLAVIHWRRYWRSFLLRHPLASVCILLPRAARLFARRPPAAPPEVRPETEALFRGVSHADWSDSSDLIAKIVYVATGSSCRGRAVGSALYRRMFEELGRRAVTRLDAHIELDNEPSIRLHLATGWSLAKTGGVVFATRPITET